jgi:hypothetical protein
MRPVHRKGGSYPHVGDINRPNPHLHAFTPLRVSEKFVADIADR